MHDKAKVWLACSTRNYSFTFLPRTLFISSSVISVWSGVEWISIFFYITCLGVLRSMLALPRMTLFWTRVFDVPGIFKENNHNYVWLAKPETTCPSWTWTPSGPWSYCSLLQLVMSPIRKIIGHMQHGCSCAAYVHYPSHLVVPLSVQWSSLHLTCCYYVVDCFWGNFGPVHCCRFLQWMDLLLRTCCQNWI